MQVDSTTFSNMHNSSPTSTAPTLRLGDSLSSLLLDSETDLDDATVQCFSQAAGRQLLRSIKKCQHSCLKRRRRVRFQTDKFERLVVQISTDTPPVLTKTDVRDLWWSQTERHEILMENLDLIEHYWDNEAEYCHAAAVSLLQCAAHDINNSNNHHNNNCTVAALDIAHNAVLTDQRHDFVRGLLTFIVPTLARRMERSIAAVLEAPPDLYKTKPLLLAARYRHASQYAAVWARVVAEQDAIAAGSL